MRRLHFIQSMVLVGLITLVLAPAAHAQATRTWVSGMGDDVNPCSCTAPCKTFAGAISKTAAGGEISVLDPGGFGAVTITKGMTINGDGTLAGILSAGVNGIIVNAAATDKVIIRSLSINGAGTGVNGIRFLAGAQLVVDNVTISGCTTAGIDVSLGATGLLHVTDTRITKCATGINLTATAGVAAATLDNVRIEQVTNGVNLGANGRAVIRNSVFSGNSSNGVLLSAGTASVDISNSMLSFNSANGLSVNASGAVARISGNAFFNNSTGIAFAAGGTIESDGSNVFAGNAAPGGPPNGAPLVKQ